MTPRRAAASEKYRGRAAHVSTLAPPVRCMMKMIRLQVKAVVAPIETSVSMLVPPRRAAFQAD